MKLIIYIFSLSLVLCSGDSQAFSFTKDFNKGFYWGSLPITFKKFVVNEEDKNLLEQVVSSAEQEWEDVIGQEIWSIESGVNLGLPDGGNFIRWSDNFAAETGYDPNSTLAVTIRRSVGTYIVRTEIILNGELDYLRENWDGSLKKTLLHELGHTVGLGHSENTGIMENSISSISALSSDDHNGMNALLEETQSRQASGYISPEAAQDEESALACGSVDITKNTGPGAMGSLVLGFLLSILLLSGSGSRQSFPVNA